MCNVLWSELVCIVLLLFYGFISKILLQIESYNEVLIYMIIIVNRSIRQKQDNHNCRAEYGADLVCLLF